MIVDTTLKSVTKQRSDALLGLIGKTAIIPLHLPEVGRTLYAKCEFLNPSGSIKDRLARTIVIDAENRGLLDKSSIILECTSGNTGIAFAMVGAARGYRVSIVMSERASGERRRLIEQLGAELILFPEAGYQAGIETTRQMAAADSRYFLPRQFENPLNALDHEQETAIEILEQMSGQVDAFVSGYGTDPLERVLLKEAGVNVFTMHDIDRRGMSAVIDRALELISKGNDGIHVSFDMDVLDPREVPGIGTPVPGGITLREAHLAMELVHAQRNLLSLDLVETNPILDNSNLTAKVAVELICSALGETIF